VWKSLTPPPLIARKLEVLELAKSAKTAKSATCTLHGFSGVPCILLHNDLHVNYRLIVAAAATRIVARVGERTAR
jgi:hypothetical protein